MTPFSLCSYQGIILKFRSYYHWQTWCPCKRPRSDVKGQGHRGHEPFTPFPYRNSSLNSYGDEMMHKAWCCLEELPFCFSRSSVKFQGHTAKKASSLTNVWRFQTVTSVWIQQWLWNDAQRLKQHRRGALLFFKVTRQISRSHGTKYCQFLPKLIISRHGTKNYRFWSELSVSGLWLQFEFTHGFEMMHKAWCSIEEVPYCFWCHPSNFKVTLDKI